MASAAGWYAAGVEQRSIAKWSVGYDSASTDPSRCRRQGHDSRTVGIYVPCNRPTNGATLTNVSRTLVKMVGVIEDESSSTGVPREYRGVESGGILEAVSYYERLRFAENA